jgi:pyruvate formate lyase activating enzyme
MTPEAADSFGNFVRAAAVWLHSPDTEFYRHYTGQAVGPVLNTILILRNKGVVVEVLHQIIATQTDHPRQVQRLRDTLCGIDCRIPVHLERFVPVLNYDVPATSGESIRLAYEILRERMPFVYVREGNISEMNDTMCAECGYTLAHRQGELCDLLGIKEKRCVKCGTAAPFVGL